MSLERWVVETLASMITFSRHQSVELELDERSTAKQPRAFLQKTAGVLKWFEGPDRFKNLTSVLSKDTSSTAEIRISSCSGDNGPDKECLEQHKVYFRVVKAF